MAQDSWPSPAHNAREVTDAEYEKIAARFSGDGIYGDPTNSAVVTAGAGRSVNIRANVHGSVRGHAWFSGTTTDNLPIAANTSGSTRIDWVVLRLDRSTWTVRAAVRQGTPGAGAPTLVRDEGDSGLYEVPLARVTVLSGAASVSVTRAELYVGSRVRPCTSSTRNPYPTLGELAYETDTGRVRLWNGQSWTAALDDSGVINVNSSLLAWSNEVDSVLEKRNGSVHLRLGSFQRQGSSLSGAAESRLPVLIPSAYRHPTRDQYGLAYITGVEVGRLIVYSAASDRPGQVWLVNHPSMTDGDFVLPASGISWVVD